MKITDLELVSVAGPPLPAPMHPAWVPGMTLQRRGAIILKIHTDEGIVGLGCPGYAVPPNFESWIKPQLIGKDPFAVEQHARMLRMANTGWGVEIALWDIIGKAAGQPLYKLWGGYADRVPAYASFVEVRTPEQRAEDVQRIQAEGYQAVKLRLHAWTMKEDLAQVEALRSEGIGQLRKVAALAELHHKLVAPHHGGGGIGLAAHLHRCAAIPNASYLELWHDPPCLTGDVFQ